MLTVYTFLQIFSIGTSPAYFVMFFGVLSGFYVANWEEYHTGVLKTNFKGFGITESHLSIISIFLAQALSKGALSEVAMHDVGRVVAPGLKEEDIL